MTSAMTGHPPFASRVRIVAASSGGLVTPDMTNDKEQFAPTVVPAPATPLYGRDQELSVLTELAGRAREGAGGALILRGGPGSGKSALLGEVAAQARNEGMQVLS